MKEFVGEDGRRWRATAREEPGPDFKGRWYLVFESLDDSPTREIGLADVRWNSQLTAERTLRTMAEVELRRRLSWALARTPALDAGSGGR